MWTSDLSSIIFTMIKAKFSASIKKKYPNLYFTNSNKVQTSPKFPTVYIHEMGSTERGNDFENFEINAVLSTFQIDVTDNQSQNRAGEVMDEVVRIMKSMRFSVVTMPEFRNADSTYRSVARFRRAITENDLL